MLIFIYIDIVSCKDFTVLFVTVNIYYTIINKCIDLGKELKVDMYRPLCTGTGSDKLENHLV